MVSRKDRDREETVGEWSSLMDGASSPALVPGIHTVPAVFKNNC